jgi:hypothetical protein
LFKKNKREHTTLFKWKQLMKEKEKKKEGWALMGSSPYA